jgi:hypothetical protein
MCFGPAVAQADTHSAAALPDTFLHVIQPGESLVRIAGQFRSRTCHYTLGDLLDDIRRTNTLTSDLLRPGHSLRIPTGGAEAFPVVSESVASGHSVRGIYLTGPACGSASLFARVDSFIVAGGNAVVFDAKDIDGAVTFASADSLAGWGPGRSAPLISNLSGMIRRLHQRQLYVSARLATFLDGELGRRRPDLALTDSSGSTWGERGQVWLDPAQEAVHRYNIALAAELAAAGVDEIQFDYVRYPTNGWRAVADTVVMREARDRCAVITGFLRKARTTLQDFPVLISADIYGVMAFDRVADRAITGQDIAAIAQQVDVICPMLYPSHFGSGFGGVEQPADHPARFVAEGCRRFAVLAQGAARIRPWLQAFPYRTTCYDAQYVQAQMDAALQAGAAGWCLWNPAARYEMALVALKSPRVRMATGAGLRPSCASP